MFEHWDAIGLCKQYKRRVAPEPGPLPVSDESLVAYWNYGTNNGHPTFDSGIGNPSSSVPGVAATAHITGARNGHIFNYANASWQDRPNTALSVGAWVNPDTVVGNQAILGKAGSIAGNREFSINRIGDTYQFDMYDDSNIQTSLATPAAFAVVGRWAYVGLSWTPGNFTAFAGDELGNTESLSSGVAATNTMKSNATALMVFGDTQQYASFLGPIDEAYYFDRGFSGSEFLSMYNNGAGATYEV